MNRNSLTKRSLGIACFTALLLALVAFAAPVSVRNSVFLDVPPMSTWTDAVVLAPNVAESYTVPEKCYLVVFNATGGFWVRRGGAAAIPSTEVTNGTAPFYMPAARLVAPGDTLSLISDAAVKVSIQCHDYTGG